MVLSFFKSIQLCTIKQQWTKNDTKGLFLIGVFFVLWLIFEKRFLEWIDREIWKGIIKGYEHSTLAFVIVGGVGLVWGCIRCVDILKHRLFTPYNRLLFLLFFLLLYWYSRGLGYYSYKSEYFNVNLFDVISVFMLVYFIIATCSNLTIGTLEKVDDDSKIGGLIKDEPIKTNQQDIFKFGDKVNAFVEDIVKSSAKYKLSIAINGKWGEGKSSYVNLMQEEFLSKKYENRFIVLNFNPRHSKNVESIQYDFFQLLYERLKIYDARFSSLFSKYLKAIHILDKPGILDFILEGKDIFFEKEDEKKLIDESIKRIGKRIIVFIDDLDRLLANEIIEVFKLIDGTASFANFIFITCFDKEHVNELISDFHKKGDTFFSDKFFDIEKRIPLIEQSALLFMLEELLVKDDSFNEHEKVELKDLLNKHESIVCSILLHPRDIIRFVNIFKQAYLYFKINILFKDYFLLTLIKYRYNDVYRLLFYKKIISQGTVMLLDNDEIENSSQMHLSANIFEEFKIEFQCQKILEELFVSSKCTLESLNHRDNYSTYFREYPNYNFSLVKMKKVIREGLEQNRTEIIGYIVNNEASFLNEFLGNIFSLKHEGSVIIETENEFYNYLDILIFTISKTNDSGLKMKLVDFLKKENEIELAGNQEEFIVYLNQKLKGEYFNYPYLFIGDLLLELARGKRDNADYKKPYIFTKEELLAINRWILKDLIQEEPIFNQKHLEVLYNCIDYIEENTNRTIHLDKEACALVRKLIEENPEEYLKTFVRLEAVSNSSEWNGITGEPFWAQIFAGDLDSTQTERVEVVFRAFIFSDKFDGLDKIITVRNFWELYENNNYQAIQFEGQGNVQEKIDRGLVEEKKQLDQILALKEDFDNLEINMSEVLDLFKNDKPNYVSGETFVKQCLKSGIEIDFLYKELCELRKLINEVRDEEKFDLHIDLLRVLRNFDILKLKLYEGYGGLDEAIKILEDENLVLELLYS